MAYRGAYLIVTLTSSM